MTNQEIKIYPHTTVQIPAFALPSCRTSYAIQLGVERNIIMKTWGGLGDQICAEPTLRFALKAFKDCQISLASEYPQLFQHLKFHEVFNLKRHQPIWERYFPFDTIRPPSDIQWQFMSHMLVNCVDYPSLCAFRMQLPIADREVKLEPADNDFRKVEFFIGHHLRRIKSEPVAAVHPGRHWQSKTFPVEFWNGVLERLKACNVTPVLIGADTDDNRGTVDVDTTGCIDTRNKLTIMQTVALLQSVPALLTNDSAPLHMAASGRARIGFVATCKHPDMISHWRFGQWSAGMKNFGRGGIWDVIDYCPNKDQNVEAENVGDELLRSWLPDPVDFANYAVEACDAWKSY